MKVSSPCKGAADGRDEPLRAVESQDGHAVVALQPQLQQHKWRVHLEMDHVSFMAKSHLTYIHVAVSQCTRVSVKRETSSTLEPVVSDTLFSRRRLWQTFTRRRQKTEPLLQSSCTQRKSEV